MDNFGEVDPAAEFLAREQNDLAGLEDDLNNLSTTPAFVDEFASELSPPAGGFDLIAEDSKAFPSANDEFLLGSESINNAFDEGSLFPLPSVNGRSSAPAESPTREVADSPKPSPTPQVKVPREEPEKIRLWREEQKKRLEEKDLNEAKKIEEWKEAAKKELEEWYRHHEDLVAKVKATNRELALNAEKEQVLADEEIVPGTEWERIAKLCDFNPKAAKGSKDVSRMRSIILQLKQNPLPPRA